MTNALTVLNTVLLTVSAFMGIKHGSAMILRKPHMLEMFAAWGVGAGGVLAFGLVGTTAAVLTLFPRTFFAGNFVMAACLLLLTALCLQQRDLLGALREVPFVLLPLLIVYLQYPLGDLGRLFGR
jgi:hypothetical protein